MSVDKCHIFPEAVHAGSNLLSHPALLCAETEKQFMLLCSLNAFKTSSLLKLFFALSLSVLNFMQLFGMLLKQTNKSSAQKSWSFQNIRSLRILAAR